MELGASDPRNNFTPGRAAQSLQYWQTTAQQVLADPEAANSTAALKSYSHDAVAAANLLAAHNFTGEAEQAYQLATQLWPENPGSVSGLADLLVGAGRESDARQLLENFARQYPGQQKDLERTSAVWRLLVSAQAATH
jgi:Flp pilus assembly protein TadD